MASSKKKRVLESEQTENSKESEEAVNDLSDDEDADSDDNMSDESENEFANHVLNVELEARTPEDSDYHGIRTLLQMLFNKTTVNVGDMTDIILSQNYVGCVLKQITEDDDDDDEDDAMDVDSENTVFGIMTVINITDKQGKECVNQLKSLVTSRCKAAAPAEAGKVLEILHSADNQVGFLISERLYGLPAQVAVPSLKSLKKDMEKACRKKMKYDFTHFLMLCQTYQCKEEPGVTFYTNPEEELVAEMSDHQATWKLTDDDDDLATRTMVLFSADKLDSIIGKIEEAVAT
ncbi:protein BCCIP homolog [Littorina saxatilis]|uniref:Protein BCCIP homolog n=1 Tax=Littorina saxatilis TaxID=31220 RepID=A0AAN9GIZ1_9CAEN